MNLTLELPRELEVTCDEQARTLLLRIMYPRNRTGRDTRVDECCDGQRGEEDQDSLPESHSIRSYCPVLRSLCASSVPSVSLW